MKESRLTRAELYLKVAGEYKSTPLAAVKVGDVALHSGMECTVTAVDASEGWADLLPKPGTDMRLDAQVNVVYATGELDAIPDGGRRYAVVKLCASDVPYTVTPGELARAIATLGVVNAAPRVGWHCPPASTYVGGHPHSYAEAVLKLVEQLREVRRGF